MVFRMGGHLQGVEGELGGFFRRGFAAGSGFSGTDDGGGFAASASPAAAPLKRIISFSGDACDFRRNTVAD